MKYLFYKELIKSTIEVIEQKIDSCTMHSTHTDRYTPNELVIINTDVKKKLLLQKINRSAFFNFNLTYQRNVCTYFTPGYVIKIPLVTNFLFLYKFSFVKYFTSQLYMKPISFTSFFSFKYLFNTQQSRNTSRQLKPLELKANA